MVLLTSPATCSNVYSYSWGDRCAPPPLICRGDDLYPAPTLSFIPDLKPSFSANPPHCSLSFSSSWLTTWFSRLLLLLLSISVTAERSEGSWADPGFFGSQPVGNVSHKPGGRLPLLSTMPAITLATLRRSGTSFAARWTEARWCEQFA